MNDFYQTYTDVRENKKQLNRKLVYLKGKLWYTRRNVFQKSSKTPIK